MLGHCGRGWGGRGAVIECLGRGWGLGSEPTGHHDSLCRTARRSLLCKSAVSPSALFPARRRPGHLLYRRPSRRDVQLEFSPLWRVGGGGGRRGRGGGEGGRRRGGGGGSVHLSIFTVLTKYIIHCHLLCGSTRRGAAAAAKLIAPLMLPS